ncbi:MAG TPA: MFS transporter [Candidatus Sulfotelmatobacter sp.]|nr:MFS transporter [Candidatus Sulfotelmatobacter sp.]
MVELKAQINAHADGYFAVFCIMGAFAVLSSTMSKTPVLNPFATTLGTPTDLLGVVASASTIPGILISLPAASLSDQIGRRKVLLFSSFVFASAPFLYLFVGTWWQLAIVRFYHGFATAIFVPVTEATIAELYQSKRGERISILNSATGLGRTIAPILGGVILTAGGTILLPTDYNYNTLYLAVAISGVTAFVLIFLLLTERRLGSTTFGVNNSRSTIFQGWREIARNRNRVLVGFIQASQYYVYAAIEFFIVGYMVDVAKLDALLAGIFLSVVVATLIITRPFLGRFSDTKGRRLPIIIGSIISCVLPLAIPFTTQFSLLLLVAIGYGFGFAMVISSTSPLMTELAPQGLVGASMGFLSTLMDIGQTLGPFISGAILASFNHQYTALFISLSLVLLVSTLVFSLSDAAKKTKQLHAYSK